jgi:PAS domain S-box-containing protein
VLVVEDSEDDAQLIMRELERGGYKPDYERVETPKAMQEALASSEWDVIISDHRMPRFGSPEALALYGKSDLEAPFIVVSGTIGEELAVEAIKAGAHDYVMKDNLTRLRATVERGLKEAAERRERRRVEEELRASEGELRALFEAMSDVILVLDGEGRYLKVAPTNPSLLYKPPAEMLGKTVHEIFPSEQATDFLSNIRRALKTRQTINFEYSLQIDRRRMWFDCAISPMLEDKVVWVARDATERKRAENVYVRQAHQTALRADLSAALAEGDTVQNILQRCTESMVRNLGAAFARIWTLNERESVLQLRASAGAYTSLDGSHSQVPIGKFKIGLIAQERRPHLTNDVASDPRVSDHEWAVREGMVAFAGYPLTVEDRLVGVVAMFAREPLAEDTVEALASVADTIAQGIERKRAEEALRQSERLYRAVMEQATENICLVDAATGRIVESNPTFQNTLGYSAKELERTTLYDVVAHDRESVDRNLRRILEQKAYFVGQRRYRRGDGSLVDVEVSASTIHRDGKEAMCIIAHDITERVRAQELLEERVAALSRVAADLTFDLPTQEILDALARSAVNAGSAVACGVVLVDENADAPHLFGSYGLPEGYTSGLQAAYRLGARSPSLEAFRTRQPLLMRDVRRFLQADPLYAPIYRFVRQAPWDITYNLPLVSRGRALGAIFFCYLPKQEPSEDEKAFLGAVADQAAIAVENARLFGEARGKAVLEERQRLARELHDSVSQALYGIALGAKSAREWLDEGNTAEVAEPLDYVLSLAEAGMAEMRSLIFELRPESLESEGVVAALEKQAAALRARHRIEVKTELCDEPEAPLEAKEAVYRIAQEALHNIVKHARASSMKIRMVSDTEQITLAISDDGIGFDAKGKFPGHLGLRSMRERASYIGGTVKVKTVPNKGTLICARLPI